MTTNPSPYDVTLEISQGGSLNLNDYKDKVLLIVNTATKCGLAPQFEGLEALHKEFGPKGLQVIGIPSNQFADQEPESDESMTSVCKLNHGVTFPLTKKAMVNGPETHPLIALLKQQAPGFLGAQDIKWNFTKFLIWPRAERIKRFAPTTKPAAMEREIRKALVSI
jgi:glutathione peroxidase